MSAVLDLILNGKLQSNLDCDNHKLINLDTSEFVFGQFGPQPSHTVFAGPSGAGPDHVPSFRLLTASEVGAQPHSSGLDLISPLTPTETGMQFITMSDSTAPGYPKIGYDSGFTPAHHPVQVLTPTQLRTDISAQPLNANLTTLAGITPTQTGDNFLSLTDPTQSGYPKIDGGAGHVITILTPAQLAADLALVVAPFVDSTSLVKGSSDATKQFRIEVDGFTASQTRVMTPPDRNFTPATIDGGEALINKYINGLRLYVGSASDSSSDPTYTDTPGSGYSLASVAIGYTPGAIIFRTTAPTDVVLPITGTLATVGGTIPLSYLSTNVGLGTSDALVPTQKAVKTYVDAHSGAGGGAGSGKNTDLAVSGAGSNDLVTSIPFVQWYQRVTIAEGVGTYAVNLYLLPTNAETGAIYRIRLELARSIYPTVNIYNKNGHGVVGALLQTIASVADTSTVFVFEAVFNGTAWDKYSGYYVT